ncbi:MAG: hypothetical protein ACPHID_06705 [Thermoplasmatota archaeon]
MESRRKTLKNDSAAQVGIGTMIVFIATVLVAAIAAGVLISTSSDLQEKSAKTGSDATEQVASNLDITSVVGVRDATSDAGLKDLQVFVALAPGASEVDLEQLKIQVTDGTELITLDYSATAASATAFAASAIRDADSSFSAAGPVMNEGDLVQIDIDLDSTAGINMEFSPRDDVKLTMLPEVGNPVEVAFDTPNSYGSKLIMELS